MVLSEEELSKLSKEECIAILSKAIEEKNNIITQQKAELKEKDNSIAQQKKELKKKDDFIASQQEELKEKTIY